MGIAFRSHQVQTWEPICGVLCARLDMLPVSEDCTIPESKETATWVLFLLFLVPEMNFLLLKSAQM